MTQAESPRISAIIAARNAAGTVGPCLESVCSQAGAEAEVIMVDDYSLDPTAAVAARFPIRLIALPEHRGVAAARNAGAAAARAPIVLFVDADVILAEGALARAVAALADPSVDAVIGSYDDQPAARSIVSLFKNLAHHYYHQRSNDTATTFWGACGAIRRDLFMAVGGFDEKRFLLPSIEDVELGWRLAERGAKIRLDRDLQVKHLKRWTIGTLLKTDVMHRAIPWTLLALERSRLPSGLNFSPGQRVAALVALGIVLAAAAAAWRSEAWAALATLLAAAWLLNRRLFELFFRQGGIRLAAGGFLLQQIYYLYSLCGVVAGVMLHFGRRLAPDWVIRPR